MDEMLTEAAQLREIVNESESPHATDERASQVGLRRFVKPERIGDGEYLNIEWRFRFVLLDLNSFLG